MLIRSSVARSFSLLTLSLFFTACSGNVSLSSSTGTSSASGIAASGLDSVTSSDPNAGNLQLLATVETLPANISDVVLNISSFQIQSSDGSSISTQALDSSLDFSTLNSSPSSVAQFNVGAGNYGRIRVTFSSIAITDTKGNKVSFSFANQSSSSGVQDNEFFADLPASISTSTSSVTHLLLDFGSILKFDGGNRFKPVQFSARSLFIPPFQLIDLDMSGSISGTISSSSGVVAGCIVAAVQNGKPIADAFSDANGNYELIGLQPGTYDIYAGAKGFAIAHESAISVSANGASPENVSLTASASTSNNMTTYIPQTLSFGALGWVL